MRKKFIINNFVMYIIIFILSIYIVSLITSYFYSNLQKVNKDISTTSDYTTLNLYMLRTVESRGVTIKNYGLVDNEDISSYYITFLNDDGTVSTFVKEEDIIYFNKIKICNNVQEFKVIVDRSEKESISVEAKINNKVFNSQYVLN